jgi:hypothetical protein
MHVGTYNWETKLFEDPAGAIQTAITIAKKEAKEEIREEYLRSEVQKEGLKNFWEKFYSDNKWLKGQKQVVDFIVARDSDLNTMQVEAAAKEIAKRAEAFLKGAGVSVPSGGKPPPIVEGGPEKTTETEADKVTDVTSRKTLGSVLKERAKQRAQSRHGNMQVVK